jgi:hypothetical protein
MSNNRVCPGRFFASEAGPAIALMILWAFHIERIEGPASLQEVEWVDSIIRSALSFNYVFAHTTLSSPPFPFKLRFRPRNDKILKLLQSS